MKRTITLLIAVLLPVVTTQLSASEPAVRRTVQIVGRGDSTVTTQEIRLGDIAEVRSEYQRDNEAVIALRKIVITESPEPGETKAISAAKILARLREEGVNLKQIGYAFPRNSQVQRAGRELSLVEIQQVIEEAMAAVNLDATIQSIEPQGSTVIAPGLAEVSAKVYPGKRSGELSAMIEVKTEGLKPKMIPARLLVDQWIEVPVANRPLARGSLISATDVMMARLNISQLPPDAAVDPNKIVGLETRSSIGYGEVFRNRKLEIPPTIAAGSRITLRYKSAGLEATATGVSMEDGILGQRIKVRNESSGKVLFGEVLEPGLVGVNP